MNVEVHITYDITRRSDDLSAYKVTYVSTYDAPYALVSSPTAHNNIASLRGVYSSRLAARDAARTYMYRLK